MPRKASTLIFLAILVAAGTGQLAAQAPATLTLQQAEALALKNHPQILAAQNEASYTGQQVIEARAPYYPFVNADVTGSQGKTNSRIGAGSVSASRLFDRFGQGATFSQLITDSGRTPNLVATARFEAQASDQNYQATRFAVLLQVNQTYFNVLHSQALVKVAEQTLSARQLLADQVHALAAAQLKSQLDASFADVNVSQAKLLLLQAQDSVDEAFAELGRSLGSDQPGNYQLVEQDLPAAPPNKPDDLVAQAVANRPEVASLRSSRNAAYKFAAAENDLSRPSVSLVGIGGFLPYIDQGSGSPIPKQYEGVAVNLDVPIFNGHLFSARSEAARYRAMEADQRLRDEEQRVARDVRIAWASATNAYQRLDVSAQFMRQAALALDLAQGRYNLGLSSIVELTQAQLNLTQAEIENLSAKYDYQSQYAAFQYTLGQLR
jgi:outer membrane protein